MSDIRNDFINAFVPDQEKMADWFEGYVKNLLLEAQLKELDDLPNNVADLREYLPKRGAELQEMLNHEKV